MIRLLFLIFLIWANILSALFGIFKSFQDANIWHLIIPSMSILCVFLLVGLIPKTFKEAE